MTGSFLMSLMMFFLPQGRYPENFVLISQLQVCQEGGVKKGGSWRTLRVLEHRHLGHGHP